MRNWVIAVAVLASIPAWADSRFRVAQMTRTDVPPGKGQCDIRLQVDNEVEVSVRRDMVVSRTLSGADARDDGSECNFPLPDRDVRGFSFQGVDGRVDVRLVAPPSPRNDFAAVIRIRDSAGGFGRYHFRLNWDAAAAPPTRREDMDRREAPPTGPDGFARNNVMNFRGHGTGESRFNDYSQRLGDVSVDIDFGSKIAVSFAAERGRGNDRPARPVVFTGTVTGREAGPLRGDMVNEDSRLLLFS